MIVTKKDEKLIKPGDDINIGQEIEVDLVSQDDRYSIAVVENPLYAEAEHENVVSYHKAGADEDGDEEEVKVHQLLCNRSPIVLVVLIIILLYLQDVNWGA